MSGARRWSRLRRAAIIAALVPLALGAIGGTARAQNTELTVTGAVLTFPAPTANDFLTGYLLYPTPVSFTVNAKTGPPRVDRIATVSVRATAATLGGGKPSSDIEWSALPAGPWLPLSTLFAAVASRPMQKNRLNDPWSGTIYFRLRLDWSMDVPATYTTGLEYQLSVVVQ